MKFTQIHNKCFFEIVKIIMYNCKNIQTCQGYKYVHISFSIIKYITFIVLYFKCLIINLILNILPPNALKEL